MKDLLDQISLLVRARYPVIQLLSHEEERVLRALDKLSKRDGMALWTWTPNRGLVDPDGKVAPGDGTVLSALQRFATVDGPALLVLLDAHEYLRAADVVRRLRELTQVVGPRQQAIVTVGYKLHVPPELQKDVAIIDVPLPSAAEVERLLRVLARAEKLDIPDELFEQFVQGSLGLTEREIKRMYARILLGGGRFGEEDLGKLAQEKRQAIRKSRYLEFWDRTGSIDDVGGMDNLKRWLVQRKLAFSQEAREFGLPQPSGLFMLGVQGCGKSLMAKAVADLWRFPLLRLDVAAVFAKGDEEQSLRNTTKIAESLAPVVLWIDELEKGFADGGGGEGLGHFLTWMQEKEAPVFVVATANEVRVLPPELLRKGRFDEIFFVDLPNVHERLQILDIHLRSRGRDPEGFDLTALAEDTEKFSGAELEQLVVAGLFHAFADGRSLDDGDLVDASRDMVPLAVTMDDRLKELREWARTRARPASTDRRRIDFFADWEEAG
ncbi:MAG: AAA family ATPase [Alphaproteobacteria bacterium]|nr:AAA family ATPase [Alphaproteobacteria bacterium]